MTITEEEDKTVGIQKLKKEDILNYVNNPSFISDEKNRLTIEERSSFIKDNIDSYTKLSLGITLDDKIIGICFFRNLKFIELNINILPEFRGIGILRSLFAKQEIIEDILSTFSSVYRKKIITSVKNNSGLEKMLIKLKFKRTVKSGYYSLYEFHDK